MTAKEFHNGLFEKIKDRNDIEIKKSKLKYKKRVFDFVRISSKKINPTDKIILIRAGVHGEEIAGPLTFFNFINEIIEKIHEAGLKFIFYPLVNPSGFETGKRFNIDDDEGMYGNDDFLYYELKDGSIVDGLHKKIKDFVKWHWSSNKEFKSIFPYETAVMHKFIKADPLSQVKSFIDLHQDYLIEDAGPVAYHYSFGDFSVYKNIVKKIEKIVPIYKNKKIDIGNESFVKTNDNGFATRHDGTLSDLLYRLGVKYCVVAETTGKTPLEKAMQVNMEWIDGIIDLVKEEK
jgi:hypothetical protein